ncbi:hypothetical protein CEXT_1201 [Caerostris extrusa]|uniref:Uncharacterized protein n=1 Tax=Caerostris extrusa TaxID=172846 RepID=A0AAV4USS4_CAEEX|nr:hypothetical protein CEXT_1201 [Caerostris extrusa]
MDYAVDLDLPEQPNQRRSSASSHFIGRSAPIESCVLPLPKVFNPVLPVVMWVPTPTCGIIAYFKEQIVRRFSVINIHHRRVDSVAL